MNFVFMRGTYDFDKTGSFADKTGSGGGRKDFLGGGSNVQKHATVRKTNIYRVVSCQGEFTTCL